MRHEDLNSADIDEVFREYKRMVITELRRLQDGHEKNDKRLDDDSQRITKMEGDINLLRQGFRHYQEASDERREETKETKDVRRAMFISVTCAVITGLFVVGGVILTFMLK